MALPVQVLIDLVESENMITRSEHVDAEFGELVDDLGGHAEAARRVLAIGHGETDAVLALYSRKEVGHSSPSGPADYVSYEQDPKYPVTWHTRLLSFPL